MIDKPAKARIEFDCGVIKLHSDGPWQALTAYEVAQLIREGAAAIQAAEMWRRYPPATDYSDIPG